ncbi:MAG: type II secretion system protein [Bacilli bacterium]
MNKKGFTLTELIAVIAILGILALIATPAVLIIRKNVLLNTLDSKISQIKNAAEDYASKYIMEIPSPVTIICNSGEECRDDENNSYIENEDCLIVLVRTLVSRGYLAGDKDEKEILTNPIDGSSLNNLKVCIRYNNNEAMSRKVFSYIINEDKITDWDNYK